MKFVIVIAVEMKLKLKFSPFHASDLSVSQQCHVLPGPLDDLRAHGIVQSVAKNNPGSHQHIITYHSISYTSISNILYINK